MTVVKPLGKEQAPEAARPVLDSIAQNFGGRVPAFFGMMAHRLETLKAFAPFYGTVVGPGTVDAKLKELAYLKTSLVNGCEY